MVLHFITANGHPCTRESNGLQLPTTVPETFRSDRQKRLFDSVISGIEALGYGGKLCQKGYEFSDWFGGSSERIRIPAATFARQPADYDSACVAVFLQNGGGPPLRYRSLGAPFGIEVQEDAIVPWSIGRDASTTRAPVGRIPADALDRFFTAIQKKWSPPEVLRAKNIGSGITAAEIGWIDMGLIPALEGEISGKLDGLLTRALSAGQQAYQSASLCENSLDELFCVLRDALELVLNAGCCGRSFARDQPLHGVFAAQMLCQGCYERVLTCQPSRFSSARLPSASGSSRG